MDSLHGIVIYCSLANKGSYFDFLKGRHDAFQWAKVLAHSSQNVHPILNW